MKKVAILAYDGCSLFELGCAVELFGLKRPEIENWYQSTVVAFDEQTLKSTCGIGLTVSKATSLTPYSMLIVPSWPTAETTLNPRLREQIIGFHNANKRIISFCSGAFLLAELGILEGSKATTHWRYADKFKRRFKDVEYVDDVLYVLSGNIGTSAGSAAAIDLGLAIIRDDFGSRIANNVARRLVMAPHRKGGQSQYIETPVLKTNSIFDDTLSWALENLNSDIPIESLAKRSHMSRRSFDRRFRSTHGCSAKEWLTTQRINLAKTALEQSQTSIERIAESTGFDNAHTLRHHFRKHLGLSPRQYRDQFNSLTNHFE